MASYSDVAIRYICGGDQHPDHDTICSFRRQNKLLFEECFVKVLALAGQMKVLKKVGGISVDGSKIAANASKYAAVDYDQATQMIDVLALMLKAENADNVPLDDGLTVPDEIARRQDRIAKLEEAKRIIEARFSERKRQAEENKRQGRTRKNRIPRKKGQLNFTDPESRIMMALPGLWGDFKLTAA
jgi:hypothetical protein